MNATDDQSDTFIYDARITAIDHPNHTLVFSVAQGTHRIPVGSVTHWTLGSVGRLRLPTGSRQFAFHTYADPLLSRAPGLDDPSTNRWGWRLGERRFTVEAGILPGRGGAVVRRDTEPLSLDLPREFLELCEDCGLTPSTVQCCVGSSRTFAVYTTGVRARARTTTRITVVTSGPWRRITSAARTAGYLPPSMPSSS
jgi:hypothetical protein